MANHLIPLDLVSFDFIEALEGWRDCGTKEEARQWVLRGMTIKRRMINCRLLWLRQPDGQAHSVESVAYSGQEAVSKVLKEFEQWLKSDQAKRLDREKRAADLKKLGFN